MLANLSVDQALLKAKSLVIKGEIAQAQTIYKTILKNSSTTLRQKSFIRVAKTYIPKPIQRNN